MVVAVPLEGLYLKMMVEQIEEVESRVLAADGAPRVHVDSREVVSHRAP